MKKIFAIILTALMLASASAVTALAEDVPPAVEIPVGLSLNPLKPYFNETYGENSYPDHYAGCWYDENLTLHIALTEDVPEETLETYREICLTDAAGVADIDVVFETAFHSYNQLKEAKEMAIEVSGGSFWGEIDEVNNTVALRTTELTDRLTAILDKISDGLGGSHTLFTVTEAPEDSVAELAEPQAGNTDQLIMLRDAISNASFDPAIWSIGINNDGYVEVTVDENFLTDTELEEHLREFAESLGMPADSVVLVESPMPVCEHGDTVTVTSEPTYAIDAANLLEQSFMIAYGSFPDHYAGCWIDANVLHVGVTTDDEDTLSIYKDTLAPAKCEIIYEVRPYSYNQLEQLRDAITDKLNTSENTHAISSSGVDLSECKVTVTSSNGYSDELYAELVALAESLGLGADAIHLDDRTIKVSLTMGFAGEDIEEDEEEETAPDTSDALTTAAVMAVVSLLGCGIAKKKK